MSICENEKCLCDMVKFDHLRRSQGAKGKRILNKVYCKKTLI